MKIKHIIEFLKRQDPEGEVFVSVGGMLSPVLLVNKVCDERNFPRGPDIYILPQHASIRVLDLLTDESEKFGL